jgi:hypothetical protein
VTQHTNEFENEKSAVAGALTAAVRFTLPVHVPDSRVPMNGIDPIDPPVGGDVGVKPNSMRSVVDPFTDFIAGARRQVKASRTKSLSCVIFRSDKDAIRLCEKTCPRPPRLIGRGG